METLKFSTNLKCGGCVLKVTDPLNKITGIKNWNVDLESSQKLLTVECEESVVNEVKDAFTTAGYLAEQIS